MTQERLIWDLPVRLCHWTFAASLTTSFAIALLVDEHHPWFGLHVVSGLIAGFVLVLRIVLGLVGAKYARFFAFPIKPRLVVEYFRSVLLNRKDGPEYPGNNPGSALAAVAMFVLVPIVLFSGINAGGEAFEEVHAAAAFLLAAVIVIHLLGIAVHTVRTREFIGRAMLTGRRRTGVPDGEAAGRNAHLGWGLVMLVAIAGWAVALFNGYSAAARTVTVPLVGYTIRIGDGEGRNGAHESGDAHEGRGSRDDDDSD